MGAGRSGVSSVKEAGIVERIVAPSPRFLPASVSLKGLPFCAPRGCKSVITGWAERLDAETINAETIKTNTRHDLGACPNNRHATTDDAEEIQLGIRNSEFRIRAGPVFNSKFQILNSEFVIAHLRPAVLGRSSSPTRSPSHDRVEPDRRILRLPRARYLARKPRHRYLPCVLCTKRAAIRYRRRRYSRSDRRRLRPRACHRATSRARRSHRPERRAGGPGSRLRRPSCCEDDPFGKC